MEGSNNIKTETLCFTAEQMKALAEKYPWFDAAKKAIYEEHELPPHIMLLRSVRPSMSINSLIGRIISDTPKQPTAQEPSVAEEAAQDVGNVQASRVEFKTEEDESEWGNQKSESGIANDSPTLATADSTIAVTTALPHHRPPTVPKAEQPTTREMGPGEVLSSSTIEIIDEFIVKGEHKVVPQDDTPEYILAGGGTEVPVDDELVTEELGQIYLDQELFEQAIAIYERLSLLYPEKSVYFAEIIAKAKISKMEAARK